MNIGTSLNEAISKLKLAYSVSEVSEQTSLSKSYVRNEITAGNLKARKFGRRVLVLNEDLEKYLRKQPNQNEGVVD